MAQQTTAETAQIATFQRQAIEASNRLRSMLTALTNQLAPLEANWIGSGGSAFRGTTATVQAETTRMNQALEGIAADVGVAGVNYASADEEQGGTMNSVNGSTTGITSGLVL